MDEALVAPLGDKWQVLHPPVLPLSQPAEMRSRSFRQPSIGR